MATSWPLEARLHLIHEIYLVIGENTAIHSHHTPQSDTYWLIRAIIKDTVMSANSRSKLISTLKKSPVWDKASQFLVNSDARCAYPKCNGHKSDHKKGVCTSRWCGGSYGWSIPTGFKCSCKEFKPKKL
jgi:hypothetical protein